MRTLVVLALLGCVSAAPFLQDTPEVVAERARFQQLYNAAAAAAAAAPDPPQAGHAVHHQQVHHVAAPQPAAPFSVRWTGPVAATIPAGVQGSTPQVPDTAEVAAARNAFLAAYRAQVAATTGQVIPQTPVFRAQAPIPAPAPAQAKWVGPVAATIPAGLPGSSPQVADTPEVAAARSAFLNAYNRALASVQPTPQAVPFQAPQQFKAPVQHPNAIPVQQAKWVGPVAATVPAGLPGSVAQVPETADVSAATAAFHQAYNAAVAATTGRRF